MGALEVRRSLTGVSIWFEFWRKKRNATILNSRLGYCNSFLNDDPASTIAPLWSILHTASKRFFSKHVISFSCFASFNSTPLPSEQNPSSLARPWRLYNAAPACLSVSFLLFPTFHLHEPSGPLTTTFPASWPPLLSIAWNAVPQNFKALQRTLSQLSHQNQLLASLICYCITLYFIFSKHLLLSKIVLYVRLFTHLLTVSLTKMLAPYEQKRYNYLVHLRYCLTVRIQIFFEYVSNRIAECPTQTLDERPHPPHPGAWVSFY